MPHTGCETPRRCRSHQEFRSVRPARRPASHLRKSGHPGNASAWHCRRLLPHGTCGDVVQRFVITPTGQKERGGAGPHGPRRIDMGSLWSGQHQFAHEAVGRIECYKPRAGVTQFPSRFSIEETGMRQIGGVEHIDQTGHAASINHVKRGVRCILVKLRRPEDAGFLSGWTGGDIVDSIAPAERRGDGSKSSTRKVSVFKTASFSRLSVSNTLPPAAAHRWRRL